MSVAKNLTGQTFGRLVIKGAAPKENGQLRHLCQCACGKTTTATTYALTSGRTISCGCARSKAAETHGLSGSREYRIWHDMHRRCRDPKNKNYASYGERGIRVCDDWSSFDAFYRDMGPANGLTLDRIDNDGNYEPGNCAWATLEAQARNRRNNRLLTHGGETKCLTEWAEIAGIDRNVFKQRIRRGWPMARALNAGAQA